MRRVVIIGGAGGAKWALDVFLAAGHEVIGFMDNFTKQWPSKYVPNLLGKAGENSGVLSLPETFYFVATGDNALRREITGNIVSLTRKFPTIAIHPCAVISRFASLGMGSICGANAIVGVSSKIGHGVIVNESVVISHDCEIGHYAQVSPGAVLCGYVTVGDLAFIGAGAKVIPHVEIGEGAVVAAGAAVTKDVEPYTMVAGVPAVFKKGLR